MEITWWLNAVEYFFDGLITITVGLVLVNLQPNWKKVLLIALFYAVTLLYLDSLPLLFGLRILFTLVFLSTISMIILPLSFYRTFIVIFLGITFQFLLDGAVIPIVLACLNITIKQANHIQTLLTFLPQFLISALVVYLSLRCRFYILDFSDQDIKSGRLQSNKREKLTIILYICILIFVVFEMIYNLSDYGFYLDKGILSINLKLLNWISNITVITAIIMVSVILKYLSDLSRKESEYIIQKSYLETLEELNTGIRAQQHDLINHLQTLYGFLQLECTEEAVHYLESLLGDTPVLKSYVNTGSVALSSLFYIKAGLAIEKNIDFKLEINTHINEADIPPYEINRMAGNLINNAFEAVASESEENRWVKIKVDYQAPHYIIEVSNYGNLTQDLARGKIKRGFTTKDDGHHGLGLYITKILAEKYNGKLLLACENNIVTISLVLPSIK